MVNDAEVVELWKAVLVYEMQTTLLGRRTFSITVLHKTAVRLLTFGLQGFSQGVMVLLDMKAEEVSCGEVLAT